MNGQNGTDHNGFADPLLVRERQIINLEHYWRTEFRWRDLTRTYTAREVVQLRGTLCPEHTVAHRMSRKLWHLLRPEPFVHALGAVTGLPPRRCRV